MEYCGAGSVSDIIRLRNKTVSESSPLKWCCAKIVGEKYIIGKICSWEIYGRDKKDRDWVFIK